MKIYTYKEMKCVMDGVETGYCDSENKTKPSYTMIPRVQPIPWMLLSLVQRLLFLLCGIRDFMLKNEAPYEKARLQTK